MVLLVKHLAPTGSQIGEYDRQHLALYAAMLDADAAGRHWTDAASDLIGLDIKAVGARACWTSHLERARWIVGDGLANAILAFGQRE